MDKNSKNKEVVAEEAIPGLKVAKKVQNISKKTNDAYYKDVQKKMGDYDKASKTEGGDSIEEPKFPAEGKDKEFHDDMEIRNGQEMIQYDREPNEQFKDRAKKSLEGDSTMGNETYEGKWNPETGEGNGNTEEVWGSSGGKHTGKELVKLANASKKKRNDATGTFNQFGDDIEMSDKSPKVTKKKIATEGMKRIKFKKPFDGVSNAIKLIPEAFRVNGKTFELTDGNEKYTVKWKGNLAEGKAIILNAGDDNLISEDFNKIKHLMGYKSEDTLGTPTAEDRVNENINIKQKI
mgnify:CR=1 FL=1|tara:strand:- start:11283 stop:12158 length:876 start_codon:yes stop_codon:yes gene_type:complete